MNKKIGLLFIALVLLATGPSWAGDVLSSLSHRDKFYDIALWDGSLWTFGFPGHAISSRDKGKTWYEMSLPKGATAFSFGAFNERIACISGPHGLLLRTEDQGKNWKKVELPSKNHLFDMDAVEGTPHAWVTGHFNTIFHSSDQGESWRAQQYELPEDAVDEPGLNGVSFVDSSTGYIVGEFGLILKTTDGGRTWKRLESPVEVPLYDVHFINAEKGVAVGTGGAVIVTEDGGETWTRKPVNIKQHLFAVAVQGDTVFAVGQEGYFTKGPLSGEGRWTANRVGVYTWLNAVYFLSDKVGFIAGGRGTILKTEDGGKSWAQLSGR